MDTQVLINQYTIELKFSTSVSYQSAVKELSNNFNHSTIAKSYLVSTTDSKKQIEFTIKNREMEPKRTTILYENCEELLYLLHSHFHILTKDELKVGISEGLKILKSEKFLYLIPNQLKFLLEVKYKNVILVPIFNEDFNNEEELYEYYKLLFSIMIKSLEGFVRSKVSIENKRIVIEYYDGIDQFIYLMKEVFSSKKLFKQNFSINELLIDINKSIVKHLAQKALKSLAVDASYDHPLSQYKYLTLMTYKLFAKLSHDGSLEHLDQEDIQQLADAMTFNDEFKKMPNIICTAYQDLNKALPFRTLEKIYKKSRYLEYSF